LTKPIINFFTGEKNSKTYRQFLSDPQNHRKYGNFRNFIDACINELEALNPDALLLGPGGEKNTI
jgi:hypothetical protein